MLRLLLLIIAFCVGLASLIFFIYALKIVYYAKGEPIRFEDPNEII